MGAQYRYREGGEIFQTSQTGTWSVGKRWGVASPSVNGGRGRQDGLGGEEQKAIEDTGIYPWWSLLWLMLLKEESNITKAVFDRQGTWQRVKDVSKGRKMK